MMLVSIVLAYIFTLKLCVQKNMQCHAHFKVCSSFHLCFVLFAQRSDRMLLSMHKMYNLHESNVFDILFVDKGLITLTFSYMKSFFMISYMKTTLFFLHQSRLPSVGIGMQSLDNLYYIYSTSNLLLHTSVGVC